MRFVIGAILGLLVGAVCAVMAYNAISQRHAYSRGLMTVMGQALKQANDAAASTDCTNDGHALAKLSLLADDIETAIPGDGTPDRVFHQYSVDLKKQVEAAKTSTCTDRKQALTDVKNACSACHRDYK